MKVAIIGAGNMGSAIARGIAQGYLIQGHEIYVSNPSDEKLNKLTAEYPTIHTTNSNQEAAANADIVIAAVKPWVVENAIKPLRLKRSQIFISLAAGIKIEQLAHFVDPEMPIFRLIPNTAIAERASMTLIAYRNASEKQIKLITDLFNEMGMTMVISENKIEAATALASCGIAYILKYVQASMQAGVEMGLSAKDSMRMTAQALEGAAEILLSHDTHPSVEIDKVTTPGGLTIKGINELECAGFSSAVIRALKASK